MHANAITHPHFLQRSKKTPRDHTVITHLDGILQSLWKTAEKFLQLCNKAFRRPRQCASQWRKLEQQRSGFGAQPRPYRLDKLLDGVSGVEKLRIAATAKRAFTGQPLAGDQAWRFDNKAEKLGYLLGVGGILTR